MIAINPFEACAFYPADILLPRDADMTKWSVVACDQYTSQPGYWEETGRLVGGAPSTLRLILPEIYLEDAFDRRIREINRAMDDYLAGGLFAEVTESFIYLERALPGGTVRMGLVGMLDLEAYDYTPASASLARATEGVIADRLPPRARIRENAALELPHVMLLINDPSRTVIEPFSQKPDSLEMLYDFELMQNGGHVRGYRIAGVQAQKAGEALRALAEVSSGGGKAPFLYAVGDGNHSLAAAKSCYEKIKAALPPEEAAAHPARYALCEVVNLYDLSLTFEPIHRVATGVDAQALMNGLLSCGEFSPDSGASRFETIIEGERRELFAKNPLAVAALQPFLDAYAKRAGAKIDYIHGEDVTARLSTEPGTAGFILPPIPKDDFFDSIGRGGALPRKTFSMGNAHEKRYYLECRKIIK